MSKRRWVPGGGLALTLLAAAAWTPASATWPAPTPSPTVARATLKEIGRVRARTAYCSAFEMHFNATAHGMIEHDGSIGALDFTLDDVTKSYDEMDGEVRRADDRRKLIAYIDQLNRSIPATQIEIDALREASALTSDPDQAKRNRELAADLQRGLDRQKQIATDALGVVHALMDLDSRNHPADDARLPGAYDPQAQAEPKAGQDVKHYLRLEELRDRIGDAEAAAANVADAIVTSCS